MIPMTKNERRDNCLQLYKKLGSRLKLRSYQKALKEKGIVNPKTEEYFSKQTLNADLAWVRREYAKTLADDHTLIDIVTDLREYMEQWRETNPNSVIGGMKLLSEWLDMPTRLSHIIQQADYSVRITDAEYKEYLELKAKEQE